MVVRRILAVGLAAALPAAFLTFSSPAHAASWPSYLWSDCSSPSQIYCVESRTRNGNPIVESDDYQLDIYSFGGGDEGSVGFAVYHVDGPTSINEALPGDEFGMVVRFGDVRPREMYGNAKNVLFDIMGNAADGWKFSLTFQPVPIHWVGYDGDTRTCTVGGCGNDSWISSLNRDGFASGYVTDLGTSGLDAAEIRQRVGMISAYNAQDANIWYDPDENSLVIRLANPHLAAPGVPATGSYETFLPNTFLIGSMNVPDPASLTDGSITVVRTSGGTSSEIDFEVDHYPGGVGVRIDDITYSRPTYRIHPKISVPGTPRGVKAKKVAKHSAKVTFKAPLANGGRKIDRYQARCHRSGGKWHSEWSSTRSVTVKGLPRGKVFCQVRAHNSKGYGRFTAGVASYR